MSTPAAPISIDDTRQPSQGLQRFAHDAMACTFGVCIATDDAKYARQAAEAAFDEIDRLEQILSRFIPTSEVAEINALRPGESARVGVETIECLQLAARLHAETSGVFNIAFRGASRGSPPLVLDPTTRAVGPLVAGVELDLGGLGKGYAVDRVVSLLGEWGISSAAIHSGQSTVFVLGSPGWRLGLRHPADVSQTIATLTLGDRALSGSGQHLHGRHIVDPRTGRAATAGRAAWAIADSAAEADALSTAFMIMSEAEIAGFCGRRKDVTAILVPNASAGDEVVCHGAPVELERA